MKKMKKLYKNNPQKLNFSKKWKFKFSLFAFGLSSQEHFQTVNKMKCGILIFYTLFLTIILNAYKLSYYKFD